LSISINLFRKVIIKVIDRKKFNTYLLIKLITQST